MKWDNMIREVLRCGILGNGKLRPLPGANGYEINDAIITWSFVCGDWHVSVACLFRYVDPEIA